MVLVNLSENPSGKCLSFMGRKLLTNPALAQPSGESLGRVVSEFIFSIKGLERCASDFSLFWCLPGKVSNLGPARIILNRTRALKGLFQHRVVNPCSGMEFGVQPLSLAVGWGEIQTQNMGRSALPPLPEGLPSLLQRHRRMSPRQ